MGKDKGRSSGPAQRSIPGRLLHSLGGRREGRGRPSPAVLVPALLGPRLPGASLWVASACWRGPGPKRVTPSPGLLLPAHPKGCRQEAPTVPGWADSPSFPDNHRSGSVGIIGFCLQTGSCGHPALGHGGPGLQPGALCCPGPCLPLLPCAWRCCPSLQGLVLLLSLRGALLGLKTTSKSLVGPHYQPLPSLPVCLSSECRATTLRGDPAPLPESPTRPGFLPVPACPPSACAQPAFPPCSAPAPSLTCLTPQPLGAPPPAASLLQSHASRGSRVISACGLQRASAQNWRPMCSRVSTWGGTD